MSSSRKNRVLFYLFPLIGTFWFKMYLFRLICLCLFNHGKKANRGLTIRTNMDVWSEVINVECKLKEQMLGSSKNVSYSRSKNRQFIVQRNIFCEATPFAPAMWPFKRGGLSSGVEINALIIRETLLRGLSTGVASQKDPTISELSAYAL